MKTIEQRHKKLRLLYDPDDIPWGQRSINCVTLPRKSEFSRYRAELSPRAPLEPPVVTLISILFCQLLSALSQPAGCCGQEHCSCSDYCQKHTLINTNLTAGRCSCRFVGDCLLIATLGRDCCVPWVPQASRANRSVFWMLGLGETLITDIKMGSLGVTMAKAGAPGGRRR